MAKFVPANKLPSLRSLLTDISRTQYTREQRSYATSVGGAASSFANDRVIPEMEVASQQQSKATGEKGFAEEKNKAFWMRDPATGDWIPEDHFGEIDVAYMRANLLPSRK